MVEHITPEMEQAYIATYTKIRDHWARDKELLEERSELNKATHERDLEIDRSNKAYAVVRFRNDLAVCFTVASIIFDPSNLMPDMNRESRIPRVRRIYGEWANTLGLDIDKEIVDALAEI